MSEPGWWACPNCGCPNRPEPRAAYQGCPGCFRSGVTGEFDPAQASTALGVQVGVYFLCGLLGLFGGLVVALIPAELLFGEKRDVIFHDFVLFASGSGGVALGLRIAWNSQVRGGFLGKPPESLPMPATASPSRRRDMFVAHLAIGATFMFFTFAFWLEKWMKGYGSDAKGAAIAALVLVGLAGGWLYFRYKRSQT